MVEIKLRKGEPVERALKRLGRQVDREGILKSVRERRAYEKPSVKRQKRKKKAKFEAYLQAKRDREWR
jgi:small subunit ribosomal protein S21